MSNSTPISYLLLDSLDVGPLRHLFFALALLLYVVTVVMNVFLVSVIVVHRGLHEPVYVFICSLFVNGLVSCSSLLPFIMAQVFNQGHRVTLASCSTQMFLGYTASTVEILNLAAMAYDRYIAICFPLSYATKLSPRAVTLLLGLVWFKGSLVGGFVSCLLHVTGMCRNRIRKIYCNFLDVVSLMCLQEVAQIIIMYETVYMFSVLLSMFLFIFYTYIRILGVCFRSNTQTRQKALSTCGPHLASIANYGLTLFLEESQTRFKLSDLSRFLQVFLSLYIVIGPSLLNSLLYGLNMTKLRSVCRDLLLPNRL